MQYRKLKAEKIFDGYRFLDDHVLVVEKDGTIASMASASEAGNDIEEMDGILTPGFINCHCHLELSHMKGLIPEGTGLVDFVFKVVTERHFSEEEILHAIAKAEDEMLANGIVAVGDICNNTLTIAQKQKARIAYYNFIEASGWLPSVAEVRFERTKQIYDEYAASFSLHTTRKQTPNSKPQTPNYSIVPHAPYSVSQDLWKKNSTLF